MFPGSGYQSPWDIWFRNKPFTPNYRISLQSAPGHTSPLAIRVTPWVGLAYFDGNNDGFYYDDNLLVNNPPAAMVANFNGGGYPNLFAGGKEVGNLIRGQAFDLDGTSMPESELHLASNPASPNPQHLLIPGGTPNPAGYNPLNDRFVFPTLNPAERNLMAQYGKVFYFEVEVRVGATGAPLGTYIVQVRNPTLDGPTGPSNLNWIPAASLQANVPGAGTKDVYYYHNTSAGVPTNTVWTAPYPSGPSPGPTPAYSCNSREVVIKDAHSDRETFFLGLQEWEVIVGMSIGSHLWLTSGPTLIVRPII